ncbi:hypothetical protein [Gallibacterium anatis]|uniref:Uncharacterized protein n=1 Tax=Gallibacterium anatis TaxID=750 RepID=A0A0A2XIK2_9PAST|nr:hypothetical protein [Gallibacterium anatis]KGQ32003.1 hypothetical protein JP32_05785 [Gallibacterium anatis]
MKKFILTLILLPMLGYGYTGKIDFETKGLSINGSGAQKQKCEFKFENTPKQYAQCLVKYAREGSVECPSNFKIFTIGKTCLTLTKLSADDIGEIEYSIFDEKGNVLNEE